MKQFLTYAIQFFLVLSITAQTELIYLKNITTKEGLSSNSVNSLVSDNSGYLWFGTQNGLSKFDGTNFINFNTLSSSGAIQRQNDISAICKLRNGELLVGSWGGGLSIVDPIVEKIREYPLASLSSQNIIKTIAEDGNRQIWVGSFGGGAYSLDPKTNKYEKAHSVDPSLPFEYCQSLIADQSKIWLASWKDGLGYIDTKTHKIYPIPTSAANGQKMCNFSYMLLRNNKLYLSNTWGDLYTYDIQTKKFEWVESFKLNGNHRNRITSLVFDKEGILFVSTEDGLYKYNLEKKQKIEIYAGVNGKKYGLLTSSIVDEAGIVWFGTSSLGAFMWNPRDQIFDKVILPNHELIDVNIVYPYAKDVFLLGTSKGVKMYNALTQGIESVICVGEEVANLSSNNITCIKKFKSDFLIGTTNGLFLMDRKFNCTLIEVGNQHYFYASHISDIEIIDGAAYVASKDDGLLIIRTDGKFEHYSKKDNTHANLGVDDVNCILDLDTEHVLISTKDGLLSFHKQKKLFVPFTIKNGNPLYTSGVNAMTKDEQGNLWIGTNVGLVKYNLKQQKMSYYGNRKEIKNNDIQQIALVKNKLWASTKLGLFRLDLLNNSIELFTVKDGLVSNTFGRGAFYIAENGTLYFGCGDAVTFINSSKHIDIRDKCTIVLDELYVNFKLVNEKFVSHNEHISSINEIRLKYDENNLRFLINPIDFTEHSQNEYAYKLEGFSEEYQYRLFSSPFIEFTNLNPGEYTLYVNTVNDKLEPNSNLIKLHIYIQKPYWRTLWFYAIILLLLVSIFYFYYLYKVKSIIKDKRVLEKKIGERTKELANTNELLQGFLKDLRFQKERYDSNVSYAALIQNALMSNEKQLEAAYKEVFVINKPKDIVSGDFYWHATKNNYEITVVADCTGHGVSGAFLSLLGISILNFIVHQLKITKPSLILEKLELELSNYLNTSGARVNDGMDISVISYKRDDNTLEFSGAMSKGVLVSKEGFRVLRGNRFPIGGNSEIYGQKVFETLPLVLEPDTALFLFTDGIYDQFNHLTDKKMTAIEFRSLLKEAAKLDLKKAKDFLEKDFETRRGDSIQTDDVLLLGIKFGA